MLYIFHGFTVLYHYKNYAKAIFSVWLFKKTKRRNHLKLSGVFGGMETLYLEKFSYFRRCEPTILKIRFGFAYTRFQVQNLFKIAYIKIVLYTHSLERFVFFKYIILLFYTFQFSCPSYYNSIEPIESLAVHEIDIVNAKVLSSVSYIIFLNTIQ